MATQNQLFEGYTDFIATRGVKEYRETIPVWINADDVVLEIGCEWGTTTTLIAPHCRKLSAPTSVLNVLNVQGKSTLNCILRCLMASMSEQR